MLDIIKRIFGTKDTPTTDNFYDFISDQNQKIVRSIAEKIFANPSYLTALLQCGEIYDGGYYGGYYERTFTYTDDADKQPVSVTLAADIDNGLFAINLEKKLPRCDKVKLTHYLYDVNGIIQYVA